MLKVMFNGDSERHPCTRGRRRRGYPLKAAGGSTLNVVAGFFINYPLVDKLSAYDLFPSLPQKMRKNQNL